MKLPIVSGKELIKFLHSRGFEITAHKGSHIRMKKRIGNVVLVTVVPLHKALDPGTLLGILRQCEIQKEDFIKNRQ